ncbi:MAG: acetate--CoA ligase family protein [Candidatus Bathyarchaeia archaeon]
MLEEFLAPRSIAVIGASRNPGKVGYEVLRNLVNSKYRGRIYPVNPNASEILGIPSYPSILSVEGHVDLALIAVPAPLTLKVAEECGRKGVKGLIVITAGFSEAGSEGAELEHKLVSICKAYGMRMLGPNCLGIVSPASGFNASFTASAPLKGEIAIISQSGAICSSFINWFKDRGVGFSHLVSLGNQADLTESDFIEALGRDRSSKVILLYIEGVKDGARFIKACKEAAREKPVVAVKAGVTEAGVRSVSSHTGSLAGSAIAYEAAFRKSGVIKAENLEELLHLGIAFSEQPLPRGDRVLIVTNGGGPGIIAADACEKAGLRVPSLNPETVESLRRILPPQASYHNPVDVLGDADDGRYYAALKEGLRDPNVDAVIVILTPQAMSDPDGVADAVSRISEAADKPIFTVFMGLSHRSRALRRLAKTGIPNLPFPELAVNILEKMIEYRAFRSSFRAETYPTIQADKGRVRSIIEGAVKERRVNLSIDECLEIARAYGIEAPNGGVATNEGEACELATSLKFPIAMKVVSPDILHKTDVGGVVLGLDSPDKVEAAFRKIISQCRLLMPQAHIRGVFLQEMAKPGKEVIVGVSRDPQFGPLLMFGLGGIYVNFLRDVAFGLCPLSREEAYSIVKDTKAYILLRGVRGEPPSDVESVVEVILAVSQLVTDFPEIVELDMNPIFVYPKGEGCRALDIKITIKV